MYSPIKTSLILNKVLTELKEKKGSIVNFSNISKNIGVSRKRFTEMVNPKNPDVFQEPSFSLLSKIIEYFRLEGYSLRYADFLEKPLPEITLPVDNIHEYTLNHFIPPMYDVGSKIKVTNDYDNKKLNIVLCSDSNNKLHILKNKENCFYQIIDNKPCENNVNYKIIGKITDISLPIK